MVAETSSETFGGVTACTVAVKTGVSGGVSCSARASEAVALFVAVIVAVVLALLAFRFVKGMIKLAVLALIAVALVWFFANGVAH